MEYVEHAGERPVAKKGLAIASLVIGILGLCVLVVGPLIALVLGIVALAGAKGKRDNGAVIGMSVAGIVLGGMSLLATPLFVGIMLPAVSRARENALQLKSATQMRQMVQGMRILNQAGNISITPDNWLQTLTFHQVIDPEWLEPVTGDIANISSAYFFVPPGTIDMRTGLATNIVLYEHPDLFERGGNIAYDDTTVRFFNEPEYSTIIGSFQDAQGNAYAPHLDAAAPAP